MIDWFKDLYNTSKERIKSPFISSFIISFVVFNWRAVAVLIFSNHPPEFRIEHLEANYCNWNALIFPLSGLKMIYRKIPMKDGIPARRFSPARALLSDSVKLRIGHF